MKKIFRWGILATGVIAEKFADTVYAMKDEAEVAAVASRSREKAEAFAAGHHIAKAYGSYEELAADPDIDAIYIATPHSHHFENMKLCIMHGKHVLCEKPFTVNAAQAREAFRLAKEHKVFLMEAFWTRFMPVYQDVEQLLAKNAIGKLHLVTAQYGYTTPPERTVRKFAPELAGGALLDIGVYAIGFAAMILGYEPCGLQSMVQFHESGTDALETIHLEYENGAIAQLVTAIGTRIPTVGVIYGSEGRIEVPEFKDPTLVRLVTNSGEVTEFSRPKEINGFEYQIREVMSCIAEGRLTSRLMSPERTISVMEIMDQIREGWGLQFPCE